MKKNDTALDGVYILEPRIFGDDRGCFFESFSLKALRECGIEFTPVQENYVYSKKKGTIRGLHFQNAPKAQAKIVRCTTGSVLDVAVDLRKDSPHYLKYVMVELSSENKKQIFIPKYFAHGVMSLSDGAVIEYLVDELYSPEHDRSIRYDDPQINVTWNISNPSLSAKDKNAPALSDSDINF
ncbi:MAG: dTDP-4-dehydrorhamnose 3,5-epimerase [Syntrophus sp. PtaB.Bin138]|nr:MAG: dTDP-4-dehydrorhamnose 3,5-epimerase [Syntrophus sp. PtaB.Bin138]